MVEVEDFLFEFAHRVLDVFEGEGDAVVVVGKVDVFVAILLNVLLEST